MDKQPGQEHGALMIKRIMMMMMIILLSAAAAHAVT